MEARIKHAVKRWLALILCLCMLIPTSGTVASAAEASAETDVITEEPSQESVETDSPSDKEGDEDAEENQSDGDLTKDDTAENDMTGDDMTGNENLENNKDEDKITSDDNAGEKTAGKKVVEKADSEVKASPKKNTDDVVSQSNDNSWLDGDYAYIGTLGFSSGDGYDGKSIMTGTEPWDGDDENGNDTSASNGTVRSFDVVTYTVEMQNEVREDSPHENYKEGTFNYELILPADTDEARFELDSMGWVTSKTDAQHKAVYTTTHNGKTVQVLRGSFTWTPSGNNPTAIGESAQTLNVAVRVLAMTQGEKIQPLFTFWMGHNAVPSSGLVTGSNYKCEQHNDIEYKTLTAPEITVTTAPRYNVALEQGWNTNYLGSFNFETGNDQAQNKNAGTRNGRVQAFGVTLQVQGKPGQGLRGCEIPDASKPITFDLKLSSTYKKTDGDDVDASRVSNDGFAPLLWSAEGNKDGGAQQDGRAIVQGDKYAFLAAPFNSETVSPYKQYACKNGGTWAVVQKDGTVSVTVSGYEVDLNRIPNTVAKNAITDTKYYDPAVFESGYWNVQTACFSAGEFWVVQPFASKSGTQAVDQYGDGQFNLTVEDVNLRATGVSGNALENKTDNSNQAITTDDRQSVTMALEQPGEIEQYINYSGTEITNACHDNGRDWSLKGAGINITEQLAHLGAEGQNTGVAYDDLMKFDDAFFDIESAAVGDKSGVDNMNLTLLYGAKPDKKGWDHQGKQPNETGYDEEMINATADDLIFFTSLQELERQGYTCVAVLLEARGVASSQSTEIYFTATGKLQETATDGNVYMVTHSARAWNKGNVQEAAAKALGKDVGSLTDEDYKAYAQTHFPSRAGETTAPKYDTDYPESVWTNDADNREGLKNYKKSEYDKDGYKDGTVERNYGDSCLVVNYATQIGKRILQQSASTQAEKLVYDLDSAQNVADYALDLSAIRTEGEFASDETTKTVVYVEDVLPANLTYIPYSAYLGGEYQQTGEGKQGQISGGTQIEPEVKENKDGSTTLRWTLTDQEIKADATTTIGTIYYSCDIRNSAQNNDSLPNKATIWSEDEQRKDFSAVNGNAVEKSIRVSKNSAVSLSKTADQTRVETGKTMGFTMNVGNNAANPLQIIAVDSLPYSGEGSASDMHGDSVVTEFKITELAGEFANNFKLYYTDNKDLQGKGSADFQDVNFDTDGNWNELTVNSANGNVTLPGGEFKPVAIAAVGSLPGNQTLKMHVTVDLPEGEPGDRVVNRLTMGNMESNGRSYVFGRTLEGLVWLDADKDGLQDEGETKQDGVKVTLLKLKDGGNAENFNDYEVYQVKGKDAVVTTSQKMDLLTGTSVTGEPGAYKFTNLPEGTFAVRFEEGGNILFADYEATTVDTGSDDTIDSDATGVNGTDKKLSYAYIAGIEMPAEKDVQGNVYEVKHQDLGLVEAKEETVDIPVEKIWNDNSDASKNRPTEITVELWKNGGSAAVKTLTLNTENSWKGTFEGLPKYEADGRTPIQYTVEETAVTGYESKVTGNMTDGFTITNTLETVKVEGKKTWNDHNNQDGKRPEKVTVQLQKKVGESGKWDNVSGKTAEITESQLTYSFTDLPKYENKTEIQYRVVETGNLNGYTPSGGTKDDNYNLTNSYTPGKISVSGTKTWDDAGNQDGKRPEKVTVQLQKRVGDGDWGNVDGKTATITSEQLSYTFSDLPEYEGGKLVEYRVVETGNLNGYTQSGGTKGTDGKYNLTNSYTPETVDVEGEKTWNDNNNQDGKRPEKVIVQLQKMVGESGKWDNVAGKTAEITESQLTYSFKNLPKYENKTEIQYRVVETSNLNGYTSNGGTKGTDGKYNLTNSYTPETVDVEGKKTWNDNNNQDGKRPEKVMIQLQKKVGEFGNWDDVTGKTAEITGSQLTYSFTDLPKYENKTEIQYRVIETGNLNGYTPSGGTADDNYNLTNSYTPGKVSVSGTKTWDDAGNQDGKRPEKVTVQLQKRVGDGDWGNVDGKTATITSEQLSYTFSDLPEYEEGQLVEYRVVETGNLNGYTQSGGTKGDNYDLTNSYTPETVDIAGKKTWDDNDDQDGKRPNEITVQLQKKVGESGNWTDVDGKTATINDNNLTYSFTDLPKYENKTEIEYRVVETGNLNGYTPSGGTADDNYDLTNSYTPGKVSVSGTKTWDDAGNQDGKRPASITVQLQKKAGDGAWGNVDGKTATITSEQLSYTFSDLPEYEGGKLVEYRVVETGNLNGYTQSGGTKDDNYNLTNSYTPETVDIKGTKTWDDNDDQDGNRPDEITVRLLADGEEIDRAVVTEADNWSWSFGDLPKYKKGRQIVYAITEDAVTNYTPEVNGYDVTNHYTPGKTSVSVTKVWKDNDDQDGFRPESVTVKLFANGEDTGRTVILNEGNKWTAVFDDLNRDADGKPVEYTVKEVLEGAAADKYTSVISGDAGTGFMITNSHAPETVDIEGTKTWDDSDNQDGKRPDEITIRLHADGKPADTVTVSAEDNWTWTFTDLPKYAEGREIVYTITEDAVSGYEPDYEGYNITNTHTPDKTTVTVTKAWQDGDNQDGIRPEKVTVKLLANGKDTGKSLTLSEENRWTDVFTDLDEYAAGEKIVYTVEETAVDGYDTVITGNARTGFTITNSHTPAVTAFSGSKTWDDNNDQDGRRPDSITIRLYANGEQTEVRTVTAEDDWAWTFENLPKYENGKEIIYTITEDPVSDYQSEIYGMNVTNSYTPGQINIPVTKNWKDQDDADGIRPDSITVKLYANGKETGKVLILNQMNRWTDSFNNLDEYADGEKIIYSIAEVRVKGYEVSISGNSETGFVISNSHTPEIPDVPDDSDTPDVPTSSEDSPRTGDSANPALWISLLVLSGASVMMVFALDKRRFYRGKRKK